MKKILSGYTLLELLVTLSIIAILSAIAVPSFDGVMNKTKQSSELNGFLSELHLARSEAIKRSRQIVVCPSNNGSDCGADNTWSLGRIMFIDNNRNNTRDNNDEILRITDAIETGLSIQASANISTNIRYRSDGMAAEVGELTVCDKRGSSSAQAIIINATGRPQISESNTVGGALSCP